MFGMVFTSLALAMALAYSYRYFDFPEVTAELLRALTLQFMPRLLRVALVMTIGLGTLYLGFWKLTRAVLDPLMARSAPGEVLSQIVADHRFGSPGPEFNVVAIGGGTGLATLLRGLKLHDIGITAIVTVADDGGSTGRIRNEFNMPAPGDIRNCIVALADAESTVSRLFQYRFDRLGSQLEGHSFGNLFITALTQITGSFEQAVIESGRVLAIRGRVLPSTLENVTLCAELVNGRIIRGESTLSRKDSPIKRVFLEPHTPGAYEPALAAILKADLIIMGPGSLYTSVLPNLLVDGITKAIEWSPGIKVYVCNVATQPGETDHFAAADHIDTVRAALGERVLDYAVVNSNTEPASAILPEWHVDPVTASGLSPNDGLVRVTSRDVVDDTNPLRHDPRKLASVLLEIARTRLLVADDSTDAGLVKYRMPYPLSQTVEDRSAAQFTKKE